MSSTITWNGVSYSVPATGDENWSDSLSAYLIAIASGALQKTGGTFTLTADADFGATYGLKSAYFKSRATNTSSTGIVRLGNNEGIGFRNAANSADLMLKVNASNVLEYNGNAVLYTTSSALNLLITNAMVSNSAAIAYSKLNLGTSIVNADISGSAAIAYSKLNLATSIVNGDISSSAAIAMSKLAALTVDRVLQSNASTGAIEASSISTTTLGYLDATSSVQTQLDAKIAKSTATTKGDLFVATASATVARQGVGTDGDVLTADSAQTNGLKWAAPASSPTSSYEISNLGIATSVGSSALTIALKQADGTTDPSTGASAVKVGMRSSTLTSGLYNQRSATAATSLVISSGSTLGQVSTKEAAIFIYLLDNAGTLELAISGTLYDENQVISTTAEGGAGAADSGTVVYSTTARTNVPFRLIGKLINTQTTAGTWASAGTTLQVGLFGTLMGFKAPTIQKFTSGSGTYYTPSGVKYLRVRGVGGGAGSSGSGTAGGGSGGTGGDTTFGSSLLTGAGGASTTGGAGTISSPAIGSTFAGGNGGQNSYFTTVTGGSGGNSMFGGGGAGGAAGGVGGAGVTNTGGGAGGAGAASPNVYGGLGGGAGGGFDAIIGSPSMSYAYAVGAAGTAGTAGTSGFAGAAGGSGYLEVTEYYQ